jgi:c(7)-type cytochrome triheme protein
MDTTVKSGVRRSRTHARRLALAAAALILMFGLGTFAAAQDMPRLPAGLAMTRSSDSPGQVTFKHETHVDSARPSCTSCHPREFRILKDSAPIAPITHTEMDKGRYCGSCHNGKKAFALDDCAACHEG